MNVIRKGDIIPLFHQMICDGLDPEGLRLNHAIIVDAEGKTTVAAMAFDGTQIAELTYAAVKKFLAERPSELIFGLDRFAKSNQGVEFADLITLSYYDGRGWRFGIVEYRPPPTVKPIEWGNPPDQTVKPIEWGNAFWTPHQQEELVVMLGKAPIHQRNFPPIILPRQGRRPDNLDEEDLRRRREEQLEQINEAGAAGIGRDAWKAVFPAWLPPEIEEVLDAGNWLSDQLTALGADEATIDRVCFVHGQHTAMNADPWGMAQARLEKFRAGEIEEPGDALAKRLFDEALPYFLNMYGAPNQEALRAIGAMLHEKKPASQPKGSRE